MSTNWQLRGNVEINAPSGYDHRLLLVVKSTELWACDYRTYYHLLVRLEKYVPLVRGSLV